MIPSIRQWTWYILERFAGIVVGIISEFCHSPHQATKLVKETRRVRSLVRRMAKLTDDADYDAGETFQNVSIPLLDAGNQDKYYGRRLRTRCVLHSRYEEKLAYDESPEITLLGEPSFRMKVHEE
ncbi:unnamed protein product [Protopolystoma xenopodis]|uniref:Uncharacterized protein n=1 Tax=Protopolystoma xenopodis TaxID=117903 RepID=A0A448WWP0_9PLAT|nr:unnamed protein product [Protopolystoma xenopodis]